MNYSNIKIQKQSPDVLRETADVVPTEESLIGSIMLGGNVSSAISSFDFLDQQLGKTFDVLMEMIDAELPVSDPTLLIKHLKPIYGDDVAATIAELLKREPYGIHAQHYGNIVKEASCVRAILSMLDVVWEQSRHPDATSDDMLRVIESCLTRLDIGQMTPVISMHEAVEKLADSIDSGEKRNPIWTGLESFDAMFGASYAGELVVVAARPGRGKTSFANQVLYNNARRGRNCFFASLEMGELELASQLVCGISDVERDAIRSNSAKPAVFDEAKGLLDGLPYRLWCPTQATTGRQILGVAKTENRKAPLDLIVVDYLGRIESESKQLETRHQIGQEIRALKTMAKSLGVVVIAVCQLNREADTKEPRMSNLADSADIEREADAVFFLHRIQPENKTEFKIVCGKHRHGGDASIEATFNGARGRFEDPPTQWVP